jgi:hypothetical protein
VTNHADASRTLGGHLALAALSIVRSVLGARMRATQDPSLALGALHLRAHAHSRRHHRAGLGAGRRAGSKSCRDFSRLGPTTGK